MLDDDVLSSAIGSALVVLFSALFVLLLFKPLHRLIYASRRVPDTDDLVAFTGLVIIVSIVVCPFLLLVPMAIAKAIDVVLAPLTGWPKVSAFDWFFRTLPYWWLAFFSLTCIPGLVLLFRTVGSDPIYEPNSLGNSIPASLPQASAKGTQIPDADSESVAPGQLEAAEFAVQEGRITHVGSYAPAIISVGLLLLATFGRWPYSFYVFLRIAVCLCAIYSAARAKETGRIAWTWIMASIAIVFNPVLPLHMQRANWRVFNLVGAGIFAVWMILVSPRRPKPGVDST